MKSKKPLLAPEATVSIEYDCKGKRKTKEFPTMLQAKAFYITKFRANKNPTIKKAV